MRYRSSYPLCLNSSPDTLCRPHFNARTWHFDPKRIKHSSVPLALPVIFKNHCWQLRGDTPLLLLLCPLSTSFSAHHISPNTICYEFNKLACVCPMEKTEHNSCVCLAKVLLIEWCWTTLPTIITSWITSILATAVNIIMYYWYMRMNSMYSKSWTQPIYIHTVSILSCHHY